MLNYNPFFENQVIPPADDRVSYLMSLESVSQRATSGNDKEKLAAVKLVRSLYNHDVTPPVSKLVNSRLLEMMVECLGDNTNPRLQFEAVWTLSDIAYGSSEQVHAIVNAGALPHLMDLLKSPHQNICEQAVWALGNIVGDGPELRDRVSSLGLVSELISLLKPGLTLTLLRCISWVFVNFCRCRGTPPPRLEAIRLLPPISSLIHHGDSEVMMHASWAVSYLAESGCDLIRIMAQFSIFNNLVQLLSHKDVRIQAAALRIVEYVAQAENLSPPVLNEDVVQLVIEHIRSSCRTISDHAIRAFNSIIVHSPKFISASIRLGIVPSVLPFIDQGASTDVVRNATHTIMNVCRSRRSLTPLEIIALSELIPPLRELLLNKGTPLISTDAIWALAYISDSSPEMVQILIEYNVLQNVVPLMVHENTNIQMAALRVVGNAAAGSELQTDAVIHYGALNQFPSLLTQPDKAVNKEALRILSNIAAGKHHQIQALIDAGLIPMVIHYLDRKDYDTQREAVWTIGNISQCGDEEQIHYLIRQGVVSSLCSSLMFNDTEIIKVVLISIRNILEKAGKRRNTVDVELEKCGGLDKIELLQRHKNDDIYKAALWIIARYFQN